MTPQPRALVVMKGELNPPIISLAVALAQTGREVTLAASQVDPRTAEHLAARGVTVRELHPHDRPPTHVMGKFGYWWNFRQAAWRAIDEQPPGTLLWIGSADSALALGRGLWSRPYVLHLHELYDNVPYYRWQLKEYARRATAVVVPELSRAAILRSWYGLRRTPFVLPNKPLEHPRKRKLPITHPEARQVMAGLPAGTKIVLYQGIIHADRDLRPVGRAVQRLGSGWTFVAAGRDYGTLSELRAACPEVVHVPFVPPPAHLEITSHATIGVLAYCFDNLNNVFCAPNKIWEYAGFGLPMLGNDVPGLSLLTSRRAGLCVDFDDPRAVQRALQQLASREGEFAARSAGLYDEFELTEIVDEITLSAA